MPNKAVPPEKEKRAHGRPTKYKPEYCDKVIELGRMGCNQTQMAVNLEINEDTLYEWIKVHPDFSEALTRAREESHNWWLITGKSGLTYQTQHGPRVDYSGYNFLMQSMFPDKYRQNHVPESERRAKAKLELKEKEQDIAIKDLQAALLKKQLATDTEIEIDAKDFPPELAAIVKKKNAAKIAQNEADQEQDQ